MGGSCAGVDCGGGLVDMSDAAGKPHKVYTPTFHQTMHSVPIADVRAWFLRVYRL